MFGLKCVLAYVDFDFVILEFLGSKCWLSKCFEDIYVFIYCSIWDKCSGNYTLCMMHLYMIDMYRINSFTFSFYVFILKLEDNNFKLIMDILGKIYRGEVWFLTIFLVYMGNQSLLCSFPLLHCIIHLMEVDGCSLYRNLFVVNFGIRTVSLMVLSGAYY